MGSKLSCMSKQSENNGKIPKSKKPKLLTKTERTNEVVTVTTKVIEDKSEPPATTEESVKNHVTPVESETIKIRSHISLLEPAPSSYELPKPLTPSPINISSQLIKPSLDQSKFTTQLIINKPTSGDNHIAQPVDPDARELARGTTKPATWKDLHWALIGKRNLINDELKVRALFSWLCSIPVGHIPFLTYDEIEQAERDGIQYAKEALSNKLKKLKTDSPEFVLNEMANGKATYLQVSYNSLFLFLMLKELMLTDGFDPVSPSFIVRAFESLCHYSNIPCVTVKGLAKGVDYVVGMRLNDINDQLQQQQQQQSLTSPSSTSPLSSSIMHRLQHAWNAAYLDNKWALFDPMWAAQRLAVSANTRLSQLVQTGQMDYETDMFYFNVDPAKFIYSHYPFDENWQMLKPPVTLKLPNLSQFGLHELSKRDATVTFHFRFPKPGGYKLTLYAQRIGEKLFADICEYRVESKMSTDLQQTDSGVMNATTPTTTVTTNNNHDTSISALSILPFPPTSQGHYGPAEKAKELDLITVPEDLETQLNCHTGLLEIKFTTKNPQSKLPRLTARLKSSIHETSMLTDCILLRNIEAVPPGSLSFGIQTIHGSRIHMIILTAYLPTGGEYALEVYGAPADSDENTSYFLVWQFLINSEFGIRLSTPVRKRLATMNLGPQDETWSTLGLKLLSHDDPLIHVPTTGSIELRKTRSKSEIMSQYVNQGDKTMNGVSTSDSLIVPTTSPDQTNEVDDEGQDPRSCDLKIRFSKESHQKLYVVGQFVDISTPEEEDCTNYLLQQWEEPEVSNMNEHLTYLIRIPKGDHFYKLYIYATPINNNELPQSLPLVYTYLIEAPPRIMSSEIPYIGVKWVSGSQHSFEWCHLNPRTTFRVKSDDPRESKFKSHISTILAELGWNEAHAIPVANEENQKLITKLDELQNLLFQRTNQLDIEHCKVEQLRNYMKNVQQEIQSTSQLCNIRNKEINEVLHHIKLIECEYEHLLKENTKIAKLYNDIIEKKSFLETLFNQKRKELENSSVNIDSDKNSLENLMKTIGEHDEDMKIIEKYIKQDNTKIKELDLELEKLTNTRNELKSKLDTTYTNTLVDQVKFDNITKEVKEAYIQRDGLIKQWENVINQMRQRDIQLDHFSQSEVQQHLNEIIKDITQCKEDLMNAEMKRQDFHSEVSLEALKRTVDKTVLDLEAARVLSSQLKKEKEKKLQNLDKLQESIEHSMKQLSYVTECKLTAEQYANEMDKQSSSYELNYELLCKQLNKLLSNGGIPYNTPMAIALENFEKQRARELHRIKHEHENLTNKNILLKNQLDNNELQMEIIYDLQKTSYELNSTIKERTEQINLHQIMLNKQIKIYTTENSQLNIEIQERKSKAAQDKELLQRKGDTLDNEIHILEQEIIALENTLALMNGCNTVYRMSYSQLLNDSEEIKQQTELNEQIRMLNIKSRYDQSRLKELQDLYNTMQESSTRLDNDLELYKDQTKRLELELEHRMNEIEKQNTRLKRASERMEKAKRLVKKDEQDNMGPDIEARLTKELVTYATNELLNRLKGDITIYEQARVMLSTSGIPINSLIIGGAQKRRTGTLSSSTKSFTSSHRTTPTPIDSNLTSPDSSKCSSKLCSPRNDSIGDSDGGNVQNSSRISGRNSVNDIPISTTSIDLLQQTQLPNTSITKSSKQSNDQITKTKLLSDK
ncbi:putative ubiquitin-protein ligase BRE1 [Schistosoma mansoni]|uniref:putative ubiquitin-protein ligase BRE1 n=1 Tax=Schistosoma mansoni TaxID=6183 RepID=UPI00022DC8AB|nr:putative ubiquitin-protein ligase BRE1 [Schistosoma mansoni]|eukprot:XP_018649577.1 putative ubiquitin-protein ligase BRE1 [Schistosoma mansoni]